METEQILARLRSAGHKVTEQRRVIIEALTRFGYPVTARKVYREAAKAMPGISHDTVYRNLEMLCQAGTVIQIRAKGASLFELPPTHHHHMVCVKCSKVLCVQYCPLTSEEKTLARQHGFHVLGHHLEFYGLCLECYRIS
ncbi:MAG: transcriptional repressor [Bacillota bacterium]